MIIPSSGVAVLLGTIGNISIAKLLVGGIVPGLIVAIGYILMIAIRVKLNPRLMPQEEYVPPTWRDRLGTLSLILPVAFIILLVMGLMLLCSQGLIMGMFMDGSVSSLFKIRPWAESVWQYMEVRTIRCQGLEPGSGVWHRFVWC